MKLDNEIDKLSSQIDNLLNEETKTNDFATQELRKLVVRILESTYEEAKRDAGEGIAGGLVGLALLSYGVLSSKPTVVNAANQAKKNFEINQENLEKKWELVKPKLDSLSPNELFWVLYLNRKNGFMSALTFLLSSN